MWESPIMKRRPRFEDLRFNATWVLLELCMCIYIERERVCKHTLYTYIYIYMICIYLYVCIYIYTYIIHIHKFYHLLPCNWAIFRAHCRKVNQARKCCQSTGPLSWKPRDAKMKRVLYSWLVRTMSFQNECTSLPWRQLSTPTVCSLTSPTQKNGCTQHLHFPLAVEDGTFCILFSKDCMNAAVDTASQASLTRP